MRIELRSKQPDGSKHWVELIEPEDFPLEELFAMHRAVRVKPGAASYSPQEVEDDRVNAFLGKAITAWSFPAPIPAQNGVAAADVAIARSGMKTPDWGLLRRKATPLLEELEGFGEDPKEPESSSSST